MAPGGCVDVLPGHRVTWWDRRTPSSTTLVERAARLVADKRSITSGRTVVDSRFERDGRRLVALERRFIAGESRRRASEPERTADEAR